LAKYNKLDENFRLIILDGVKDDLIPHLTGKTTSRYMWEALEILFQNKNENRKMVLREKLKEIRMTTSENVTIYHQDSVSL
jgi:predicted mannosyl-3-phosphoglycerate phosphatase (HAD superfamily)